MITEWIDKNGLIKPQAHWLDSGNGVLYSAIYLILRKNPFSKNIDIEKAMKACLKGDLLFRSPDNTYQEQWDNHLGLAAHSYFFQDEKTARSVIWYAVKHFGFFNTDDNLEWKDWLYRFPQIWAVYFIAAFPFLKWLAWPASVLISLFMKPDRVDASGTQLAWLYHYVMMDAFSFGFKSQYSKILAQNKETVSEYYGQNHPIIEMVKSL